jgi:8-oxo-dGTP pyrophosphatase MutT (NUDIX family)
MPTIIAGERVGRGGRLAVGCSATVFDAGRERVLLARRADNGRWCVPGGYMEPGESLTEACAREVREETGLDVRVVRLIGAYTNPDVLLEYADGNRWQLVVLHFEAEPLGGSLAAGDETSELGYFTPAEVEGLDMGALDRLRTLDAFTGQAGALVRDRF